MNNPNVRRCFVYLQSYDPQNCLLLDNLLKGIYSIAETISADNFATKKRLYTEDFLETPIAQTIAVRKYLGLYKKN